MDKGSGIVTTVSGLSSLGLCREFSRNKLVWWRSSPEAPSAAASESCSRGTCTEAAIKVPGLFRDCGKARSLRNLGEARMMYGSYELALLKWTPDLGPPAKL